MSWDSVGRKIQRDVDLAVGGLVLVGGLIGAGAYAFVDALIHRHRNK